MKKFGFALITFLLVSVVSMAQPDGPRSQMNPETMAKRQTERLKDAVGLDAKQEKAVYDLSLETSKKMSAEREKMRGNNEGMRTKFQEIRAEQDKKMKEILTAEQWKKYEKHLEENRFQRGGQRDGQRGGGRPGGR